jgi:hypothetical protein
LFGVPRRGGSNPGNRRNVNRHRQAGAMLLDADYFIDDATHSPKEFRHRFWMNKNLFMKIVFGVREYDDYFMIKQDCTCLWGFTSIQKCTTAMCCIAMEHLQHTSECIVILEAVADHDLSIFAFFFLA